MVHGDYFDPGNIRGKQPENGMIPGMFHIYGSGCNCCLASPGFVTRVAAVVNRAIVTHHHPEYVGSCRMAADGSGISE